MSLKGRTSLTFGPHFDSQTRGPETRLKLAKFPALWPGRALETPGGLSAEDAPVNQPHLPRLIGSPNVIRRRNRIMSVAPKPSQLELSVRN